jgi:Flp pilus assembly protein TadG
MLSDTAVDATLWLILAAMAALVYAGCVFTSRKKVSRADEAAADLEFDHAA